MAHFNFVISQNAKWEHAGFYTDCHRMTVPGNFFYKKSTADDNKQCDRYLLNLTIDELYLVTFINRAAAMSYFSRLCIQRIN